MTGENLAGAETPEPRKPDAASPLLGAAHNAEAAALRSLEALLEHALEMADALGLPMIGIDISSALDRMRQPCRAPGGDGAV